MTCVCAGTHTHTHREPYTQLQASMSGREEDADDGVLRVCRLCKIRRSMIFVHSLCRHCWICLIERTGRVTVL